jgi:hypothetical protein
MASLLFSRPACGTGHSDQDQTEQTMESSTMGLQQAKLESLPFVTAELNYLAPRTGKAPHVRVRSAAGRTQIHRAARTAQRPIFDARLIAGNLSWTAKALRWSAIPPSSRNFYDDKEVRSVLLPAAEAFLKATLKADRVFIFDHTVRKRVAGAPIVRGAGPRQPRHPRPCRSDRSIGRQPRARTSAR